MSECPIKNENSSGCPVDHNKKKSSNSCAAYPNSGDISNKLEYNSTTNDYKFDQTIQDSQTKLLSTSRAVSSIPKSDYTPNHQPKGIERWVYPSEQQYFNAMKRKGFNPSENDVPVILAIHNVVNEQGWSKIKEWESLRGNDSPKLISFTGRPKDISPKAFFLNFFMGYLNKFASLFVIIQREYQ
jgi:cytochrome c heme-lyase